MFKRSKFFENWRTNPFFMFFFMTGFLAGAVFLTVTGRDDLTWSIIFAIAGVMWWVACLLVAAYAHYFRAQCARLFDQDPALAQAFQQQGTTAMRRFVIYTRLWAQATLPYSRVRRAERRGGFSGGSHPR